MNKKPKKKVSTPLKISGGFDARLVISHAVKRKRTNGEPQAETSDPGVKLLQRLGDRTDPSEFISSEERQIFAKSPNGGFIYLDQGKALPILDQKIKKARDIAKDAKFGQKANKTLKAARDESSTQRDTTDRDRNLQGAAAALWKKFPSYSILRIAKEMIENNQNLDLSQERLRKIIKKPA